MDWGHIAAIASSALTLVGFVVLYTKVVRSYSQVQSDISKTKDAITDAKADINAATVERSQLEAALAKHVAPDSPLQHVNPELERRAYEESRAHRQWLGSQLEKINDMLRTLMLK